MTEVASDFGKWSQAGVPHRGWECIDVYDSCGDGEEPHLICEMCEHQTIRYVHVMTHPKYSDQLECGCVCAGRMEEDYAEARRREKAVRSRSARRFRFPDRIGWKLSAKGNWYIKPGGGFHVTVFRRPHGFRLNVTPPDGPVIWGDKTFPTERGARLAAFDLIEKHKAGGES